MAPAVRSVCFHGFARCVHCAHPRPVVKVRHRCPSCGRFVKHPDRCAPCAARGFTALRLPLAG